MIDTELEDFKKNINLVEYVCSFGFEVDKRKSSRSSIVVKRNSDKLLVSKDINNIWFFKSIDDPDFKGTILQFHQRETGENLGYTRKNLRRWTGGSYKFKETVLKRSNEEIQEAREEANRKFKSFKKITNYITGYLESRKISLDVLLDPLFANKIFYDERNNIIFPQYDKKYKDQGITGYSKKNNKFSGFSGGNKGVWISNNFENSKRIVVVESAFDALSYHQIKGTGDKEISYLSFEGNFSLLQLDLLLSLLEKMPTNDSCCIVGTDNDKDGNKYFDRIKEAINNSDILIEIKREASTYNDWNEQLKNEEMKCQY